MLMTGNAPSDQKIRTGLNLPTATSPSHRSYPSPIDLRPGIHNRLLSTAYSCEETHLPPNVFAATGSRMLAGLPPNFLNPQTVSMGAVRDVAAVSAAVSRVSPLMHGSVFHGMPGPMSVTTQHPLFGANPIEAAHWARSVIAAAGTVAGSPPPPTSMNRRPSAGLLPTLGVSNMLERTFSESEAIARSRQMMPPPSPQFIPPSVMAERPGNHLHNSVMAQRIIRPGSALNHSPKGYLPGFAPPGMARGLNFRFGMDRMPHIFSRYPHFGSYLPPIGSGSQRIPCRSNHFVHGTKIQLANGEVKQVEDMSTDDFYRSAEQTRDLQVDHSTVVKINEHTTEIVILSFAVGEAKVQVSVEATIEHPFFVIGQGWTSCNPDRSYHIYGLQCQKLQVGDVCISLTRKTGDQLTDNNNHTSRNHTGTNNEKSINTVDRVAERLSMRRATTDATGLLRNDAKVSFKIDEQSVSEPQSRKTSHEVRRGPTLTGDRSPAGTQPKHDQFDNVGRADSTSDVRSNQTDDDEDADVDIDVTSDITTETEEEDRSNGGSQSQPSAATQQPEVRSRKRTHSLDV